MNAIVDATVVVDGLTGDGARGAWARTALGGHDLIAPDHLHVEVASVLRRLAHRGLLGQADARAAHRASLLLPIELQPYELVADRAWELRENLTSYDGAYVALAERLDCPFVTLDMRLVRSPGPRCEFLHPA